MLGVKDIEKIVNEHVKILKIGLIASLFGLIAVLLFIILPTNPWVNLPEDNFHFDDYIYCDNKKMGLLIINMKTNGILSARNNIDTSISFKPEADANGIKDIRLILISAYPSNWIKEPDHKQKDVRIMLKYDNVSNTWKGNEKVQYMHAGNSDIEVIINQNCKYVLKNIIDKEPVLTINY
ncbi:MAG: hypothetical protein KatS3mg003_0261 [Candidatus Nitrosocaldaceae archaeon]|nr:MAG: hypothetical protein KatS3mg003_0261 [Candidatus Nitrosocaldaceae archaeon]